jgi:hypothetical protein
LLGILKNISHILIAWKFMKANLKIKIKSLLLFFFNLKNRNKGIRIINTIPVGKIKNKSHYL